MVFVAPSAYVAVGRPGRVPPFIDIQATQAFDPPAYHFEAVAGRLNSLSPKAIAARRTGVREHFVIWEVLAALSATRRHELCGRAS